MAPSDAFKKDAESLYALAPALLSSFHAQHLYADVFYEHSKAHAMRALQQRAPFNNNPAIQENTQVIQGTGIHAFNDTTNLHHHVGGPPIPAALLQCVEDLIPAASPNGPGLDITTPISVNQTDTDPGLISHSEKKHFLQSVLDAVYSLKPDLTSASVEYKDLTQRRCIINSSGKAVQSLQSMLGLCIRVATSAGDKKVDAMATYTTPNHQGILSIDQATDSIKSAIRQVLHQRLTRPIQAGTLPVLFEGQPTSLLPYAEGNAGIWLHEAIGHLLEADQYAQFPCGLLNERLTTCPLSITDDPLWGLDSMTQFVDDEGISSERTALVADGYLKGLLTDLRYASILGVASSGNGRRQSYLNPPLPRMTTLYLHSGTATNESLISSTKEGLYVKTIGHGYTHPDTQQVVLDIREGYYIKEGKLTHPISNVTIAGKALDILNNITGIGNDLPSRPQWVQCKKEDQVVPVSVASPSVLIREMKVFQRT